MLNGLPDQLRRTNMKIRLQINMVNELILVMVEIILDQNSQLVKVWETLDILEVEELQDQTSNTKGKLFSSFKRIF